MKLYLISKMSLKTSFTQTHPLTGNLKHEWVKEKALVLVKILLKICSLR